MDEGSAEKKPVGGGSQGTQMFKAGAAAMERERRATDVQTPKKEL